MTFDEAQNYIAGLAPRGWRLGLDRMEEFARRAELVPSEQKFIHVAGTNGKGSTTAMIQSALIEQGLSTGAFFSPYVVDPRERVQIGRELISRELFASITERLIPIGESLSDSEFGGVTEFEFKTALGLEAWKRSGCEFVALEVGLGGRLDATNIIEPASCAIVSIGHDHMNILGNSLEEIAFEKAGILKPGKPAIIGRMAPEALAVIERRAEEAGAPIWRIDHEVQLELGSNHEVKVTTPSSEVVLRPGLFGEIQLHNAAIAYCALELGGELRNKEAAARGISIATIPGRYQRQTVSGSEWIFDGAHNPDSAEVLAAMLRQDRKADLIGVTGMLMGHEPEEFYPKLAPFVKEWWCVPIDFHRARAPHEIADRLASMGQQVRTFDTMTAALEAACQAEDTEGYLVSGSFYLVGEIMRRLQLAQL